MHMHMRMVGKAVIRYRAWRMQQLREMTMQMFELTFGVTGCGSGCEHEGLASGHQNQGAVAAKQHNKWYTFSHTWCDIC